jgi:short-subunit dehydrogenase
VVDFVPAFALTSESIAASLRLFVTSMVAAIHESLPDMRAAGGGLIFVGLGDSGRYAVPFMSGPGPGMSAARNYLNSLHGELAPENIKVVMITLTAVIKNSAWQERLASGEVKFELPPGIIIPEVEPDTLADWMMDAAERGTAEILHPEQPPAN